MLRFTLFGIPVQVQPFFWISLVLLGGANNANSPSAILEIALFVLAGFISIMIHELGHALTARKFGAYSEITLQAFGGYAAYSGVRLTRPQTFLVTAAGPGVQILFGGLLYLLLNYVPMHISDNAFYFLYDLMWISIAWALLNLLPILPLDGGKLTGILLGPQRIKITLWITIITAVSVALLMFDKTRSYIFPIFLGMFAWQAFQSLKENSWR